MLGKAHNYVLLCPVSLRFSQPCLWDGTILPIEIPPVAGYSTSRNSTSRDSTNRVLPQDTFSTKTKGSEGRRVQELCESRGGRPGLSVLMSLTVSVDVKQHWTVLRHWSQFVPNMSTDIRGHEALHHHHQWGTIAVIYNVKEDGLCTVVGAVGRLKRMKEGEKHFFSQKTVDLPCFPFRAAVFIHLESLFVACL